MYAIVDIETTGGYAAANGITEISIQIFDGEKVIEQFETLINPNQIIPKYIQAFTGITNEMVQQAPVFEEVAEKIAEKLNATVYVFKTLKTENPFELHVTSANYDEEMARHLVKKSAVTISLHGAYSDVCTTYIGGRDEELEKAVRHALSGFPISETPVHLKGVSPRNIANGNQRHKGLQLEITTPQYEQLLQNNQLFNEYVNAVVSAVNSVM